MAALTETTTSPLVRLDRVRKEFGGVVALQEVTLDINPGEIVALVGDNGAGKSTLIKMIAGVHQPTSGQIVLEGEAGMGKTTLWRAGVERCRRAGFASTTWQVRRVETDHQHRRSPRRRPFASLDGAFRICEKFRAPRSRHIGGRKKKEPRVFRRGAKVSDPRGRVSKLEAKSTAQPRSCR